MTEQQPPRKFYLILHDISKRNNIGTLIRSASAFGCAGIVVAEVKRKSDLPTFGAHGADRRVPFFFTAGDPFQYARDKLGCRIVGVEITPEAKSVCEQDAFASLGCNVAFVLGNEGSGMHASVQRKCDEFVYIPHYGGGTASLNVAVAGSIVFQQFASKAGFRERERVGEKFTVDDLSKEDLQRMNDQEEVSEKQLARRAKQESDYMDEYVAGDDVFNE